SFIKAGFLGLQWSGEGETIDLLDLNASQVENNRLGVGSIVIEAETAVLQLLRLAILSRDSEEIAVEEMQNILLPKDATLRARIAEETLGIAAKLEEIQQRVLAISEEIDEVVASGLGLTRPEHETIRKRCKQFPLSVTVERPRYVWSADRK